LCFGHRKRDQQTSPAKKRKASQFLDIEWTLRLFGDDPAFAREFLLAAIDEGVDLQLALGKVIRAMGVKERLANAVSVYEVFPELLDRLQPSHIITQTQCRVCAVSLEDVERALAATVSSRPKVIPLEPNALADIWTDIRRVASACGISADGERLVESLQSRVDDISRRAHSSSRRPRVACIEWHEPLMAAGNWVPEMVDLAAAETLLGAPGRHSPYLTWEQLAAADPDVILTTPCGFDLARTRAELYWLTDNPSWANLRAVRNGQVYLADGNRFFNRPGPRIVESLEILAEILHPELFPPVLENTAWERLSPTAILR